MEANFEKAIKKKLNRLSLNRTMGINRKSEEDFSQKPVDVKAIKQKSMAVDNICGILSKSSKTGAPNDVQSSCSGQTQRDIASNLDRKARKLPDNSYFQSGIAPFKCQYTKELEIRDLKAEDKLLRFPIDNEEIVWEESHVPFTEHISLHKYVHLFPPQTRLFMETIVTALQNNPDLTVDKKKQVIWSYLNYFEFNGELLEEDEEEILQV